MEFVSRRMGSQEVVSIKRVSLRPLHISVALCVIDRFNAEGRREGRATPRVTAFVVPLFASSVYTVREAGLFPALVLHIENLVLKDDREQLLRQFIIY